jgi:hypothetical protein
MCTPVGHTALVMNLVYELSREYIVTQYVSLLFSKRFGA